MEFVQRLLESRGEDLVQKLVGQAGFGAEQARSFLPAAVQALVGALQGGGLDLGALLGGGSAASLLSRVDVGEVARASGVEETQARSGLETLAPSLLSELKEAGGADLLSKLGGEGAGGLAGAVGGLAGKLFR
jgi:hypothetical protein